MEAALTSKGQVTIPKEARDHLRLKPGDRVKFFIHPDGTVVILPKLSASALRGFLHTKKRASLAEMNAAIARGVAGRFKRSRDE